jgi:hypothetical protein
MSRKTLLHGVAKAIEYPAETRQHFSLVSSVLVSILAAARVFMGGRLWR